VLDRDNTGALTKDDLMRVPEVAMNPMCQKVLQLFGLPGKHQLNFKEFVQALGQFNASRSRDERLRLVFNAFDADGDGIITHKELVDILRTLVGQDAMDNDDLEQLARLAILEAGSEDGIDFDEFRAALADDAEFMKRTSDEAGAEAQAKRNRDLLGKN